MTDRIKRTADDEEGFGAELDIGGFDVGVGAAAGFDDGDDGDDDKPLLKANVGRMAKRQPRSALTPEELSHDNAMHWRNVTHVICWIVFLTFASVFEMDQSSNSHVINQPFWFALFWTIFTGIAVGAVLIGFLAEMMGGYKFTHNFRNKAMQSASRWLIMFYWGAITASLWIWYARFGNLNPHELFNAFDLVNWKCITQIGSYLLPYLVMSGIIVQSGVVEPHLDMFKKSFL